MLDLVVLVADTNMEFAVRGALSRPQALGIRALRFDVLVHPGRDGGVRTEGPNLLALEKHQSRHALLLLDYEGCGSSSPPEDLEIYLDEQLRPTWETAAKAVVIVPEVDIWMWGSDTALQPLLTWPPEDPPLRAWLAQQGFTLDVSSKPDRPKEALEAVFRKLRKPRSAKWYQQIAERISLARCTDPAFQRLRTQLQAWFPPITDGL